MVYNIEYGLFHEGIIFASRPPIIQLLLVIASNTPLASTRTYFSRCISVPCSPWHNLSAARVPIENTHTPANQYVINCTVQINGDIFGCQDASSNRLKHGCGDKGEGTQQICNSAAITINWDYHHQLRYSVGQIQERG